MQVSDPTDEPVVAPLWQLGFRAGFLAAAGFAVLAIGWWAGFLDGAFAWSAPWSPAWWHGHEILFGFAMPVVAGFVLTAVATWTGTTGTRGMRLRLLFACWLIARLSLLLAPPYALIIAAAADTLFILGTGWEVCSRILKAKQSRNYAFVPMFALLAGLNLWSYSSAAQRVSSTDIHYGVIFGFLLLITFIGGRVIPFFTARRTQREQSPILPWLDFGSIALMAILLALAVTGQLAGDSAWLRALLLVSALAHLGRQARWWSAPILKIPLLWSLHLSYLFIPIGLLALAWGLPDPLATKNAMHLLGIGAMAGMILAMIARVSLGHTGRELDSGTLMNVAFALLALGALVRGILPTLLPALSVSSWRYSALLWIIAFGLFLWRYIPILIRPRPDGKPG